MLDILDIENKTTTYDAMGCQKETVTKIIEKKVDYFIGLKGNQGNLYNNVRLYFEQMRDINLYYILKMSEKSRNRYEKRTCYVFKDISWLEEKEYWTGHKSIIAITRETDKKS